MASKIRPKNPDAAAQPPARVEAPAAPQPVPVPADPAERAAANAERLRDTLEQLAAQDAPEVVEAVEEAAAPTAEQQQAVADVMVPTRPSVAQRRVYEATYGQRVEDLCMRHGLARSSEAGRFLAELAYEGKVKVSVREDVLFPLLVEDKPTTVDQAVTMLIERDEATLGEALIADLKRYRADKVSRAVIFSFAARHLELLELAEYEQEMGRDPSSSWAEMGAPVPEEV